MMTPLDTELAELQAAAEAHAARHQVLSDFACPEGIRIAVNFTVDFDAMLLRRLQGEPLMQLANGEFGGRVGIWRLLELFNAHGVKATIFTPGRICELYPKALHALIRSGHEIADHMWEHRVPQEIALEEDHLSKTIVALEQVSGHPPLGTRSSHTAALLRKHGYLYRSEGSADQRPHYLFDENGKNGLVNLPYHYVLDDAMYFNANWFASSSEAQRIADPEHVFDIWWAAFRQQYHEGSYLNIVLHPFVSGRALRIAMLDRLITEMKALPGVWFPTCEQVARYCLEKFPPTDKWH
ncbi:MAG: polysaccharide deacetylase family protein [Acetobacteraceae bacterium]